MKSTKKVLTLAALNLLLITFSMMSQTKLGDLILPKSYAQTLEYAGGIKPAGHEVSKIDELPTPLDSSVANVSWIHIETTYNYVPSSIILKSASNSFTGLLPTPYTFHLDGFDPNQLTYLSFNWGGGGNCIRQEDNDIYCTGNITSLAINYNYYFTPAIQDNFVEFSEGAWSSFNLHYTHITRYTTSLTFISSEPPPDSQIEGELSWDRYDMRNFNVDLRFESDQCSILPSGINTCLLKPGDILLWRGKKYINNGIMSLGGTYFTHAALYAGDNIVIEAIGKDEEDEVVEWFINMGENSGWADAELTDWAVIRPKYSDNLKAQAIEFAQAKANDVLVSYDILAPIDSDFETYCSLLIWQAYMSVGLNLEENRGLGSTILDYWVTPDDLFFSAVPFGEDSEVVQAKHIGLTRLWWRFLLYIYSPAHIMLIDPEGRRTGYDPATGEILNEIPGVLYSGTNPNTVETLSVTNPEMAGDWQLILTGYASGSYQIGAFSIDGEGKEIIVLSGSTSPGKVEKFLIPDPSNAGEIKIRRLIFLPLLQKGQ